MYKRELQQTARKSLFLKLLHHKLMMYKYIGNLKFQSSFLEHKKLQQVHALPIQTILRLSCSNILKVVSLLLLTIPSLFFRLHD